MTAAAAWRDVEADRGEGEGLWPRKAAASPEFDIVRVIAGDPDTDLEGGRELRSGAIEALLYGARIGGGGRRRWNESEGGQVAQRMCMEDFGRDRESGIGGNEERCHRTCAGVFVSKRESHTALIFWFMMMRFPALRGSPKGSGVLRTPKGLGGKSLSHKHAIT